jgi:phosphoribosylaminoimidazole-succinocarboxamide synthase
VSALSDLPRIASGKVREIYEAPDQTLLLVASDRISTYDVVHPTPIPDKGKVLTGLSTFWFERTEHIVPNHLISVTDGVAEEARGRAMLVRRLEMLPVECVVRGYITGSGWKDYQQTGAVCGIELPAGLRESDQLPMPLFTPATKAQEGHDENIDFDGAAELIGSWMTRAPRVNARLDAERASGPRELAEQVRDVSIALYEFAAEHARERGIILADTKFELGLDPDGTLTLGDEVCTPDSSRFWPADEFAPGRSQRSFDKQYVRDWASSTGWDRTPPAPAIPEDVVAKTREKYVEAYERITGEPFDAWLTRTAGPPTP